MGHWNVGKDNPNYGRTEFSDEYRKFVSKLHKGKVLSKETKDKISKAHRGKKRGYFTLEHRLKIGNAIKGIKRSEKTKSLIREKRAKQIITKETCLKISRANSGENCHWWKGGITPISVIRINSQQWRKRRIECYKRDGYRCQLCGVFEKRLAAHHIIPWRISHDDSLENLITVCPKCHNKLERKYEQNFISP